MMQLMGIGTSFVLAIGVPYLYRKQIINALDSLIMRKLSD
jgi:hypothetical protein